MLRLHVMVPDCLLGVRTARADSINDPSTRQKRKEMQPGSALIADR
jgi:hypothetical protein